MQRVLYELEELNEEDLYRPPLAALRALRCTGVLVSRAGWLAAPPDVRHALTNAGAQEIVDIAAVKALVDRIPLREMKLYPRWDDPSPYEVPRQLVESLGHARSVPLAFWQGIRALDRHVLMMLSKNTRLLWRALDELARESLHGAAVMPTGAWQGLLGRCEISVPVRLAIRITSPDFVDGRALILARVAGVRAARRTGDLLDLCSHVGAGPIELGCHLGWGRDSATLLWQSHVSTAQGEFFPAASLLAVTTAATALCDMLIAEEPALSVTIDGATLRDDRWMIGSEDEVTIAR